MLHMDIHKDIAWPILTISSTVVWLKWVAWQAKQERRLEGQVHHPLEGSEYLTEEPELNSRGKPAESEKEKDEKQNEPD